jgi:hypothetical protein
MSSGIETSSGSFPEKICRDLTESFCPSICHHASRRNAGA